MPNLSDRLRRLRTERGLTQKQMAELLHRLNCFTRRCGPTNIVNRAIMCQNTRICLPWLTFSM